MADLRDCFEMFEYKGGARKTNRFLSTVMHRLRLARCHGGPSDYGFFVEQTVFEGRPYLLPLYWFVTEGCKNDQAGGCTMCNFGVGRVSKEDILWQVDRIAQRVTGLPLIYVTPLGSMFDDEEVSPEVRTLVLRRLAATGCRAFGTESRADTISEEKMHSFREAFGPKVRLQIGVGLETIDGFVRRNCLNKRLTQAEILKALAAMRRYDIEPMVHVLLKPPFLTEREAILDATRTTRWAFAHGAVRVIFFMTNLKPFTLTEWLSSRGYYRVPYLWSGVTVLRDLAPECGSWITLSGIYSGVPILQRAHNCLQCSQRFIARLQQFSMSLDSSILAGLLASGCSCRTEWELSMAQEAISLERRLADAYERIARGVFGDIWWLDNWQWVLAELDGSLAE